MKRRETRVPSILEFAHDLLRKSIQVGDVAIDATMGNGHDTLFLATLVGERGHVHAFDVQAAAIESTSALLRAHEIETERVTCHCKSHADVLDCLPERDLARVRAVIFNLGYLPGGDKAIVTQPDSTLCAIARIFEVLAPGAVIVLVVYPGHEAGEVEAQAVSQFVQKIERERAQVVQYQIINSTKKPPFVLAIEKRAE